MAYGQDYSTAARRHLKAADELHGLNSAGAQPGCKAVAGYLYGLSGEMAVKAMMRNSGMTPLAVEHRREDPFYAHFPALKTRLLDRVSGRRSVDLRTIAGDATLFQHWDTGMRYAPINDIKGEWVEAWKNNAHQLIAQMEAI